MTSKRLMRDNQPVHFSWARSVTNQQLYLREMDQLEAAPIRGTDMTPTTPFFSPDGQWVGFWANGNLRKVSVTGGEPVTLCEAANPWGASWGADDIIVFGQGAAGILRVAANGGTPEVLIPMDSEKGQVLIFLSNLRTVPRARLSC